MMVPTPDTPEFLDLRHLRLFEAVYATQSVTRAAERLGLSQPTVSFGLGELRQHFGDELFVRSASGMLPTPLADHLIGLVREGLEALRRIAQGQVVFDPATTTRRFRIAMTDASHITMLPRLLAAIRQSAPGVTLEARRIDAELREALLSGETDLALGFLPGLETDFYGQTLFRQDWICLTNPDQSCVRSGLSLRAYQQSDHVGIGDGTFHALLEEAVQKLGVTRRIALQVPSLLGLGTILASSDLIATLPRQIGTTLATLSGLVVHPCPFPVSDYDVRAHWHARYNTDPGNRWLRRLCASLFSVGAAR